MTNRSFLLIAAALAGCTDADNAPPELIGAELADAETPIPLTITAADAAFDGDPAATPTLGVIRLQFNELLDGDSIQQVARDPDTGDVLDLAGKPGVVTLIDADGNDYPVLFGYDPAMRSINAASATRREVDGEVVDEPLFLPADTALAVVIAADVVRDKAGNVMAVSAAAAFHTRPIDVVGADIPGLRHPDDADTAADEAVSYDAPLTLAFNTAIDPHSAAGNIVIIDRATGDVITTTVTDDNGTHLELTPDGALLPETDYELRVEPGITDTFGIAYDGEPRLFTFTTL